MLWDNDPQRRTISATLLNRKFFDDLDTNSDKDFNERKIDEESIIKELSKSFKEEKALYSRLAISDSLSSYGELAIPNLIQLLGKIGNNQEKNLPKKYFNKKSFPLPRDLSARTLAKMGKIATPFLIEVINGNTSNFVKSQAIDAIGAIAYKYNDHSALDSLKNFSKSLKITSPCMSWKIVRSLSGFKKNRDALNLVIEILEYFPDFVEIKWEVIRSIGRINIVNDDVKFVLNDLEKENKFNNNPQIELALKNSKNNLKL